MHGAYAWCKAAGCVNQSDIFNITRAEWSNGNSSPKVMLRTAQIATFKDPNRTRMLAMLAPYHGTPLGCKEIGRKQWKHADKTAGRDVARTPLNRLWLEIATFVNCLEILSCFVWQVGHTVLRTCMKLVCVSRRPEEFADTKRKAAQVPSKTDIRRQLLGGLGQQPGRAWEKSFK